MATSTPLAQGRQPQRINGDGEPTPGQHLAPPPKLRRRPVLIAASVAAICLGALASLWAYQSASTAHSVLAMRHTVERGQLITRDALMSVTISVDPGLHPLPAEQAPAVVGKHAALDMPAGAVVTAEQVTDQALPPRGASVVGISLSPAMLPADQVHVGDRVRAVTTPGEQGDPPAGEPEFLDAVVVGVTKDDTTAHTIVNVQVPHTSAPKLAARSATGKVALVLDSRER